MEERFKTWLDKFGKAWCDKNIDQVIKLFDSENIAYYESVFNLPITSLDEVRKLWQVVPENQKDITFKYKIILSSENEAVINWKVYRFFIPTNEHQNIDGIFQISLNQDGLCTFFKQWRTIKVA